MLHQAGESVVVNERVRGVSWYIYNCTERRRRMKWVDTCKQRFWTNGDYEECMPTVFGLFRVTEVGN